ncbi:membrane protein, partial [Acidisphaera rubrifaciens]|uniref:membrane protein n=1 Tax=Acidisphaera rubrifaciens TaxID=50715 RepID=UPI0006625DC0
KVPLHVLIPARGEETDRRLRVIEAPTYGLVGHSVTLRVAIEDLGVAHPTGTARLTVRRDGDPPTVESVPIGEEHRIEVPITRAGPTVLDLQAEALPGETSPINNRAVVEINGVRDRLRVLLISGEPHSGERTWRRLLKADPSVDLVHFTILRPPEKDDLTPLNELALIAFPVRELFQVKIREFDLIILDRFQNRGLLPMPYLRNIADYVRDGGSLLLSVGPEFAGPASLADTPLADILPARPLADGDAVIDGQFRPRVTALGERHPVTADLPGANNPAKADSRPTWGPWYRRIAPSDVHGDVLMTSADGQPLLILDRVGRGRVGLLLSDQIWLWSRGHMGGGPQAELLRRIAHWTMKEPELEENALVAHVSDGALRIDRRTTEDAGRVASVTVTDPDGHASVVKLTPVGPGHATAVVAARLPGVWQVGDGKRTTYAASAAADPLEIADLRATGTVLAPLVHSSGGSLHWLEGSDGGLKLPSLLRVEPGRQAAGADWIGLERRHDHVVTGIAALALLPAWISLPLLLGLAIAAWRREGR